MRGVSVPPTNLLPYFLPFKLLVFHGEHNSSVISGILQFCLARDAFPLRSRLVPGKMCMKSTVADQFIGICFHPSGRHLDVRVKRSFCGTGAAVQWREWGHSKFGVLLCNQFTVEPVAGISHHGRSRGIGSSFDPHQGYHCHSSVGKQPALHAPHPQRCSCWHQIQHCLIRLVSAEPRVFLLPNRTCLPGFSAVACFELWQG